MLLTIAAVMTLIEPEGARAFSIPSSDGVAIRGQADRPDLAGTGAVVMVAGTGPFDRDVDFGAPGEEPALVFLDLSRRLNARGVATVRYDKRGIRHVEAGRAGIDQAEIVTATTGAMRDDLAAVYGWTRSPEGMGARCVVLFGHSEGMVHIGRLAASGAPAPAVVVGMGTILTDPARNFRWNLTERDSWSLRMMDADEDGITTNEEVRAGLATTPAAVNGVVEPYLAPDGGWTADDIAELDRQWQTAWPIFRDQALAMDDAAPWPTADQAAGSWQWGKSWYSDETAVAANLARWDGPVIAHLGDRDSQTHAPLQREAGERFLGSRVTFVLHSGVGHTLGDHPTYGPVRPDLADGMADQIAAALRSCAAGG
jgi:hypothetical protein